MFGQKGIAVSQFATLIAGPDHQASRRQQGGRIDTSLPTIEAPTGEARGRE